MKSTDLIQFSQVVNTMEDARFWALYAVGAAWVIAKIIEALKKK